MKIYKALRCLVQWTSPDINIHHCISSTRSIGQTINVGEMDKEV